MSHACSAWRARAACGCGSTGADFFATDHRGTLEAIAICDTCPVRDACLEEALRVELLAGQSHGVFGGYTSINRRRLLKKAQDPIDTFIASHPNVSVRHLSILIEAQFGRRLAPSTITRRRQNGARRAA